MTLAPSATQTLINAFQGPKDKELLPYSACPCYKLTEAMDNTTNVDHNCTKICKSIVLVTVALISAPFILIEAFFKALISSFVLMGDSIKNSINGTMPQFKHESKDLGWLLEINFFSIIMMFVFCADPFKND